MPDPTPPGPSADRNLLFGVLALQMDFVSRDDLVAAMHAWVLAKHKPLGQVLADLGALRDDERDLLDALVQKHLQRHGGDAEKSLAAVSSVGSVRQQLEQIADPDLHASLAHVSADRQVGDDPHATRPPSAGTPTSSGLRFRVLRPHARGGLGEVFVARDEELGREVALKEIQERYADHPESRARFVLEAEINGGLEHPGIVPVYGLGTYGDGRPFYAMRFVRGDSLQEAIRRFHAAEGPRRDPGERALALRGLLGRFVDVCDAVAYAHSRGVLHRDLKPGNVMLGQYGETLVVDWGLAKVVGRPEGAATSGEGTLRPASASGSAETQAGRALGTPQFMPPEQAAGRLDELGPASDVYSLGATLYCLLTGKAPFQGEDVGEVLRRVQRGDFPLPRQVKGEVPRPLEAVCLKALALRPEGRYPTPRALAADVEAWLADEPVCAWREPLRVRAGRWARRHQTVVAAIAAGTMVALVAAGAGSWWLQRQRAERQADLARQEGALREEMAAALGQAVRFRQGGHFDESRDLLEQARLRLGAAGPTDLRGQVEQALVDTALAKRLDGARQRASTVTEGKMDVAGAEQEYAAAFAQSGLGREGEDAEAVGERVWASAVRAEVVAALDDWAGITSDEGREEWLLAVARAADPDPGRDHLRQPALWRDRAALARLAGGASAAGLSPQLTVTLARVLDSSGGDAVPLLRAAQARHPDDFWLNLRLGVALCKAKEWDEAVGHYRAALALRPREVAVHNNLGLALAAKGQLDEAVGHYNEALRLDPKLAAAHVGLGNALQARGKLAEAVGRYEEALRLDPEYAAAHVGLGLALKRTGKLAEAIRRYEEALRLDPEYAKAHVGLGNALQARGKVDEAVGHFEEALRIDPKDALAHYNLGNALRARGKLAEAVGHYEAALRLDPKNAQAHYNLGLALKDKGQLDEAIRHYEAALRLDPKNAQAHNNLGNALRDKGRLEEAVGHYEEALRIDPKKAKAHSNLGNALADQGKVDEAIRRYEEALRLDPEYAKAHYNLGNALKRMGQLDEAVGHYNEALRLDPKLAAAHVGLGNALQARGKLAEAVGRYEEALRLDPKLALAHVGLGFARLAQGRLAEARDSTRRGLDLLPQGNSLRVTVTRLLQRCERMLALEARLSAVLAGKDRLTGAAEWFEFAGFCQITKRHAAAARLYANAFAAGPKLTDDLQGGHHYNAACCAALAAARQGTDAAKLDDKERARLRKQALDWLRADLARWDKQAEGGTPQAQATVQQTLRHWQKDADLAGVRDAAGLAKLLEAERADWQKLWADVAALLKKAEVGGKQ
jgi:tetratricopeptide (TPR) repeat protein/serine/threonine protein kinase